MDRAWSEEHSGKAAHDRYKSAITAAMRASGMVAGEEAPKGFGKCDIFVPRSGDSPAIAIELKTSSVSPPEASAVRACEQIAEKGYAAEPLDGGTVWVAIGINGKRVSVSTPYGSSGPRSRGPFRTRTNRVGARLQKACKGRATTGTTRAWSRQTSG